jgi:hypothetical protein
MNIPNKAFKEQWLIKEREFNNGTHKLWYVQFMEQEETKNGFFKKLAPGDHELLAQVSVAVSVFKKSLLGNKSPTEYLVFDEKNRVSGILYPECTEFEEQDHEDQVLEMLLMQCLHAGLSKHQIPLKSLTNFSLASDSMGFEREGEAVFKMVLTYQPEVLRTRLTQYLGNLKLDYSFPNLKLGTQKKKHDSFVDFIMALYHQQYENLYKVMVDDQDRLNKTPSLFQNILIWAKHENATTYVNALSEQYNLVELHNHYHQLWRDSFVPKFKEVHDASINLAIELSQLAYAEETNYMVNELAAKALSLVVGFCNEFQRILRNYYQKKYTTLSHKNNDCFRKSLEKLCRVYEYDLTQSVNKPYINKFFWIIQALKTFVQQINFKAHLHHWDLNNKESCLYHSYEVHQAMLNA